MAFFDSLANWVINFVVGTWGFMKMIAGVIVNNTFGLYTGQPIPEEMAAIFIYGGIAFGIGAWLFIGKSLKFKH